MSGSPTAGGDLDGEAAARALEPARVAPTGKSVRLNVARIGIWSVTAMTFLVSVRVGLLGILGVRSCGGS